MIIVGVICLLLSVIFGLAGLSYLADGLAPAVYLLGLLAAFFIGNSVYFLIRGIKNLLKEKGNKDGLRNIQG